MRASRDLGIHSQDSYSDTQKMTGVPANYTVLLGVGWEDNLQSFGHGCQNFSPDFEELCARLLTDTQILDPKNGTKMALFHPLHMANA